VRNPASLLLVHGAGSGPWVYDGWLSAFRTLTVEAVDLQEGLVVEQASMSDYADRVAAAACTMVGPVAVCGWSMGGLVVLPAAQEVQPHAVVLSGSECACGDSRSRPSRPTRGWRLRPRGGIRQVPSWHRRAARVLLARAERKRGISVPSLPCPSLVIASADFPDERGRALADLTAPSSSSSRNSDTSI